MAMILSQLLDFLNLLMFDLPLLGGYLIGLFNSVCPLCIVGLNKLNVVQQVNPVAHKDSH